MIVVQDQRSICTTENIYKEGNNFQLNINKKHFNFFFKGMIFYVRPGNQYKIGEIVKPLNIEFASKSAPATRCFLTYSDDLNVSLGFRYWN